jgi:integrase
MDTVDRLTRSRMMSRIRSRGNKLTERRLRAHLIRAYLDAAGHGEDREGRLFRPVRKSWRVETLRRHLDPDLIDRIVRKYARRIGLKQGFSAHSMRATFITRALDNGASLAEVQRAAGHADATTTKLYDRRGYNPEKSASFFASY